MLVLASQSPRRKDILTAAGISFVVRVPQVEEVRRPGEEPLSYVRRLAEEKARAVVRSGGETVLGADTVVVVGDEVLEKPRDDRDAFRMLQLIQGRTHDVITGICLLSDDRCVIDSAGTKVTFSTMNHGEIEGYIASGEPQGKAGAYAIQGIASRYVTRVDGCYFNVVGLPISLVYRYYTGR